MTGQEQELLKHFEQLSKEKQRQFIDYLLYLSKQERSGKDGKTEEKR